MSKVFTVFGATGGQGGSVVRELLHHPQLSQEFKIRGITRNLSGKGAQALAKQGIEVKSAEMTSKSSVAEAIKGSHTVFLVTNPNLDNPEADDELAQGKTVVDAAKDEGVEHIIFSSLLNVAKASGGRLKHVDHFDHKAEIEDYIRSTDIPATFVLAGYFMSNYIVRKLLKPGKDNVYTWEGPFSRKAQIPLLNVEVDLGKFVVAAVVAGPRSLNVQILAAVDYYTPDRMIREFIEVTGKEARFVQVDDETYKKTLPPQIAVEMLENHLMFDSPGYYAGRSLEDSLKLVAEAGMKLTSWKDFIEQSAASF